MEPHSWATDPVWHSGNPGGPYEALGLWLLRNLCRAVQALSGCTLSSNISSGPERKTKQMEHSQVTGETEALRSSKPDCRLWSKLPSSAYPRTPSLPRPSFLHPHLHPGWVILGEALPRLKLHLFFYTNMSLQGLNWPFQP